MTITATKKTVVEATWTVTKIQAEAARVMGSQMATIMSVLPTYGEKAVQEFQTKMEAVKFAHLDTLNIKTPMQLVTALAEFETNVFGSKIEVWGSETEASMNYLACAMWEAMNKTCTMTKEQGEEMAKGWETCINSTAKHFGFTAKLEMGEKTAVVTFTKQSLAKAKNQKERGPGVLSLLIC